MNTHKTLMRKNQTENKSKWYGRDNGQRKILLSSSCGNTKQWKMNTTDRANSLVLKEEGKPKNRQWDDIGK